MYTVVLVVHSWLRWAVLLMGFYVVARSVLALSASRPFGDADRKVGTLFTIAVDVQLLLGLALYVGLSPVVEVALGDMKTAMKDATLRFWAVEHVFLMVLALLLVHVGSVLARRRGGTGGHKVLVGTLGAALLLVLLGIPWPWVAAARPLFRGA